MSYIITSAKEIGTGSEASIHVIGNEYLVAFHIDGEEGIATKRFDTIDKAFAVYAKYAEAFAKGMYDDNTRKGWLQ